MPRQYGPLGTNIWGSDKFNRLANDTNRLGFIYLLSSDHTNPLGVFRLPPSFISDDRDVDLDVARHMLEDLEVCGMIERGDKHWIRVKQWFFQETGPHNPANVIGYCSFFANRSMERAGRLRPNAFAEMLHGTMARGRRWNTGTGPYQSMQAALIDGVCEQILAHGNDLIAALGAHGDIPDGSLLHIVLDCAGNRLKLPLVNMVAAAVQDRRDTSDALSRDGPGDGLPDGLGDVCQTEKGKGKGKGSVTGIVTGTVKATAAPIKYPTTIDEHIAAMAAKKA